MMPIIKKWLYSDKDIFLREIVANASDAITKFRKLTDMGEAQAAEGETYRIDVQTDKDAKTLTVTDNGIGMTEAEVEKYITQIAFSGAADFAAKYEKANGDGIIGHFGLGFYSAYMVSENIEIFTKSYTDASAVHWQSNGEDEYTMEETDKTDRGTKIVMHIAEGEEEFLEESRIKELVEKYCSFMPYDIYLNGGEKPLNTTAPLYTRNPSDCTDEEYKQFYKDTFHDYDEPLFWVHLNMDYPYRVKGILYFPKVRNRVELEKGKVKLYANQVFIADNIKEVIPEFLMLLNGVIDCPDIPLNVSRSFLQNDRQVQKIAKHITKKVADKLVYLFKNERERFENCWKDTASFLKFGCIKDNDFYDKVKDIIIFRNVDGEYKTIDEYLGVAPKSDEEAQTGEAQTDEAQPAEEKKESKEPKTVYYVSDEVQQAQYIRLFKDAGLSALVCDTFIDPHFISYLEYKRPTEVRFVRIDADIDGALKSEAGAGATAEAIVDAFKTALGDKKVEVKAEALKNESVPAVINTNEMMRRYAEMGKYYGYAEDMEDNLTLVLNTANPVVSSLLSLDEEKRKVVATQIYYLAMLSNQKLKAEDLAAFLASSMDILSDYTK